MRILLSTTRGAGHFGPLIPFARAFLRQGHDVLVTAAASIAPMVEGAGLAHRPFADPPEEPRDAIFASLGGLTEDAKAVRVIGDVYARIDARNAFPAIRATIASWRPDVVLWESCEFGAALAAEHAGLPAIRVGIFLVGEEFVMDVAAPALAELRAELGLPRRPRPAGPSFSLVPPTVEPAAAGVHRFREARTTPPRPLPGWWRTPEWPLVYLTFGSVVPEMEFFPGVYRTAIDALAALPVRVLVTIGRERDPQALGPLPPNVHVARWVPQADVLPQAAALVCHGGSGTVLGGLTAGVPMAVLPLFADQPMNARRVEELGAGIALDDPAALAGAVRRLLDDPSYRDAARAIAREASALPPVDAATEVLAAYSQPRSVA